jgi:hypothetical protein
MADFVPVWLAERVGWDEKFFTTKFENTKLCYSANKETFDPDSKFFNQTAADEFKLKCEGEVRFSIFPVFYPIVISVLPLWFVSKL